MMTFVVSLLGFNEKERDLRTFFLKKNVKVKVLWEVFYCIIIIIILIYVKLNKFDEIINDELIKFELDENIYQGREKFCL